MKAFITTGILMLSLLPVSLSFAKTEVPAKLEITADIIGNGLVRFKYQSNCGNCLVEADEVLFMNDGHTEEYKKAFTLVIKGSGWNENIMSVSQEVKLIKYSNFTISNLTIKSQPVPQELDINLQTWSSKTRKISIPAVKKTQESKKLNENEVVTWDHYVTVGWLAGGPNIREELNRMAFKTDVQINVAKDSFLGGTEFHLTARGTRENVGNFQTELTDFINSYSR